MKYLDHLCSEFSLALMFRVLLIAQVVIKNLPSALCSSEWRSSLISWSPISLQVYALEFATLYLAILRLTCFGNWPYRQCCLIKRSRCLSAKGVPIITMGCLKSRENGNHIYRVCIFWWHRLVLRRLYIVSLKICVSFLPSHLTAKILITL